MIKESAVNRKKQAGLNWNAGTGMVAGILIGAMIALAVSAMTGDQSIWNWAIPFGLATGLAIVTGKQNRSNKS
jgi:MFS family permease